jgi:hypothetical protein
VLGVSAPQVALRVQRMDASAGRQGLGWTLLPEPDSETPRRALVLSSTLPDGSSTALTPTPVTLDVAGLRQASFEVEQKLPHPIFSSDEMPRNPSPDRRCAGVVNPARTPRFSAMPAPRFKIGQPVIYHGKRKDIVGRYIVLTIIPQRLGKFRYRIRNDEDEAVEFTVNERELARVPDGRTQAA